MPCRKKLLLLIKTCYTFLHFPIPLTIAFLTTAEEEYNIMQK